MEQRFQKIELYKERVFGDKFSATFDFVKENWRVILRFMAYLVLPVCLLQSLGMESIFGTAFMTTAAGGDIGDAQVIRLLVSYAVYIVCVMLGTLFITAVIYGLMRLYDDRPNRLSGLTMREFRPLLWRLVKRSLVLILAMIPLVLLVGIVVGVVVVGVFAIDLFAGTLLLFPIYFGIIAVSLPLMLAMPMYLMNDNETAYGAIFKGLRYGFKTWGGLFGIIFVVGMIGYVVATVVMMPYMVVLVIKGVMATSDEPSTGFMATVGLSALTYVLGIIQAFGMYLAYALNYIAVGYHYGHVMEKFEGVSVARGVDNFETMSDTHEDDSHLFDSLRDIDNFDRL